MIAVAVKNLTSPSFPSPPSKSPPLEYDEIIYVACCHYLEKAGNRIVSRVILATVAVILDYSVERSVLS